MLPKYHILTGFIFSLIVLFIWPSIGIFNAAIIFLASFLIDVDHYFYYLFNFKDFSLKNAYEWFIKKREAFKKLTRKEMEKYNKNYKKPVIIFHGIEFLFLLIILTFYYKSFLFVVIGFFLHIFSDFTEILFFNGIFYGKLSQIYVYYTNKGKKEL
ncbi:MAG: hypothetical protein QW625_02775 [Candidatus Nanoarchaeia archaeon]